MPVKKADRSHKESNNLANIIIDMRHVAGYGWDDKDDPPQGAETAV
jgi:hypothetical protein